MCTTNIFSAFDDMWPVIGMIVFAMILSTELIVSEIGSDVVELVLGRLLLHGEGEFVNCGDEWCK